MDALTGPRASQFIERFGGVLGKIPYFGKALELHRKIAQGIDAIKPRVSAAGSAGSSTGAAGQAAAAAAEPLAQRAGESAADFLARAQAAGLNPRPATTSKVGAAAGAASAGPGAKAATGAAARAATGAAAAGAAGGAAGGAGTAAAAGGAATGAAGAAAALGPVVVPVLAAVAVVGSAVVATKALIATNEKLRDHFGQLSDRLFAYSREIQLASARIAVANLNQDIEFARDLGGRLAQFNESQAKIDRSLDRMRKVIEGSLLDNLNPFLEFSSNRLVEIAKSLEAIYGLAKRLGLDKSIMARALELWNMIEAHLRDDKGGLSADGDILGIFGSNIEPRAKERMPLEWNGKMYGESDQQVTERTKINRVDVTPFLPPGNLP
ncbi:MAG: hypothetical protein WDZ51_16435 [Pirellulaceae bacterium]